MKLGVALPLIDVPVGGDPAAIREFAQGVLLRHRGAFLSYTARPPTSPRCGPPQDINPGRPSVKSG